MGSQVNHQANGEPSQNRSDKAINFGELKGISNYKSPFGKSPRVLKMRFVSLLVQNEIGQIKMLRGNDLSCFSAGFGEQDI